MALIYRNVTGPISGADGDPLATGTLRIRLLGPLVDGTTFIPTETIEASIVNGAVTATLAATGSYDFTVVTDTGDTLFSFKAVLGDDSGADISVAELYLQSSTTETPDSTELYATFVSLLDTPDSLSGQAGKTLVVNATEDGIEFV